MSLLVSSSAGGHPECVSTQVEVTVLMLQVNKAASPLKQPSFCKYTAAVEE